MRHRPARIRRRSAPRPSDKVGLHRFRVATPGSTLGMKPPVQGTYRQHHFLRASAYG
jgi:hypothetical protein